MTFEPPTRRAPVGSPAADALKAFRCIAVGDLARAAGIWTDSHQSSAPCLHPLVRAATLNNNAAGFLLRDEAGPAVALLEQAERACSAYELPRDLRRTSSAFHLRLAARNAASFVTAGAARAHQLQRYVVAHVQCHRQLVTGTLAGDMRAEVPELRDLSSAARPQLCEHYAKKAARLQHALRMTRGELSPEIIPFMTALVTPAMLDATSDRSYARGL